jgi:hypothetical protein
MQVANGYTPFSNMQYKPIKQNNYDKTIISDGQPPHCEHGRKCSNNQQGLATTQW